MLMSDVLVYSLWVGARQETKVTWSYIGPGVPLSMLQVNETLE